MGRVGKVFMGCIAGLALLLIAALVFIATFNWNHARGWIDDKVTQAIGRPFAINGDLRVAFKRPVGEHGWRAWVPWPRLSARNITVGNPAWARQQHFATLDEVDFEVEILPLLAHKIVIPAVHLVNPSVDVERMADGRNNWTFKTPAASKPSEWKLDLHDIVFSKGQVSAYDEQKKADLKIGIDTLGQPIPFGALMAQQSERARQNSASTVGEKGARKLTRQASEAAASSPAAEPPSTQPYAIGLNVQGTFNNAPVSGDGKVGGVLALQDPKRPFPIQADVKIGDTHITLAGTLTDPAHLAALDLHLWLAGVSMAHLYPLTGVTLPPTPPFATDGHLTGEFRAAGNVFTYENFTGRVGGSDLNGTLRYAGGAPRPRLDGKLVSHLLQFSDLAPVIGADSKASRKKRGGTQAQPAGKALPVEEFKTDRWKAIDVDVEFTGTRIVRASDLPISDLYAHVLMKDGVLTLEPLRFGVAGGKIETQARLDGGKAPLAGRFSIEARHLKLQQLFPKLAPVQTTLGELNGDAALAATGNSPAALAATSNGEVKLLIEQGAISQTLLEEAGLNVANIVYNKVFGDKTVQINCAAADYVVKDGLLDSRIFALDTPDALVTVSGTINLKDEAMDLRVHPKTKGFRVLSLRSPLVVKGTFKKPKVGVDVAALALRGGAVVGLGLVNPFAALIPLIAPSHATGSPCASMIAQMSGSLEADSARGVGVKPNASLQRNSAAGQAEKAGQGKQTGAEAQASGKDTGVNPSPKLAPSRP